MVSVSPEKVATPPDAVTVSVPPSVGPAGVVRQRHRHRAVEGGDEVARAVLGLDRQAEGAAGGDAGRRLLGHHQVVLDVGSSVTTPIELVPPSVNQRLPSGPAVIPQGMELA